MRIAKPVIILLCTFGAAAQRPAAAQIAEPGPRVVAVGSVAELTAALVTAASAQGRIIVNLAPGDYHLSPADYTDPTCGNCEDPEQPIPATLGLRVSGSKVTLRGAGPDSVRIHTRAGYGLLFEDCLDCRLEGLTVTGGERDTAGMATDAAVVVRRSQLAITNCTLRDNIGDSARVARTIVGIMGLCGREGSRTVLTHCRILRNSWDGVALYRDAWARIEDCIIDGVDRGADGPACGGRGVAVGLTWNARAQVEGNLIRRYWKGIGIFVDAEARVRENVVEDMLTWGIALWDADKGTPYGEIAWNAVHRTGACGISVTRGREGGRPGSSIVHNAVVRTGGNPKYDADDYYCYQRALAIHAQTADIEIAGNLSFENREPGDAAGAGDMNAAAFREASRPLLLRLARRGALRESAFLQEFR
jgi:hypothetical protein